MAEEFVREILHPDGGMRVIIVRRADGRFTYRRQERNGPDWGPATVDSGVYDSADTAEIEARQREPWLKARFH
jgi:hypothetical protein